MDRARQEPVHPNPKVSKPMDLVGAAEVVSAMAVLIGFAVAITRRIDLPEGLSKEQLDWQPR